MIPWEIGKQLVWDGAVMDSLAPSRLYQGFLCNPGITATDAEARKIEKYRELIDIDTKSFSMLKRFQFQGIIISN